MPNNPVSIKHIDISGVAAPKPAAAAKKAPTKTGAKKAAPKQKQ
jgi:hypothetical protein